MTPEDLKNWRKERGISQSQLAKMLGITKRRVEGWEQGESPIDALLPLALGGLSVAIKPA